ncbi:MAG: phosphate acyltransferase PlsX [Acidobacteriaceae bacterium]|nr:phosphate acyltransferase PlsX [Acidobacteriaceae bacterium]MBV9780887.1 phosphate acyltransferase PlsX [Acidobacteriaceae bacterium]
MVTIALDAMGSDHFPKPEVEGALQAAKAFGVKVILVGREDIVCRELDRHPGWKALPIEFRHASQQITMEETAGKAVRAKKDSSIRVSSRLVREGVAQGLVSAGNTGAVMATAKLVQGMLPGVDRPALASAFPTLGGTPAVMIDVGANVDCSPKMLAQFAVMGNIYSRVIFRTREPRVGLLSIGEEEHKGNALTHESLPLLKSLKHLNFIGNVEGRDVYTGFVDVIVCDGFVGNVALKVSEGLVDVVRQLLKQSLKTSITRKVGAYLAQGAFNEFKKRVDYSEYGGAPLLGLNGICVICHGRSNAKAIKNAIRVAKEFAEGKINERIATELDDWASAQAG